MAQIHRIAERLADGVRLVQTPIIDHPGHVTVDARWFGFVDDQGAVETASLLLAAADVRVVPEGAGIGHRERVIEAAAGRDRRLSQDGHPVHGVGNAQTVPVHRRIHVETIGDGGGQPGALG